MVPANTNNEQPSNMSRESKSTARKSEVLVALQVYSSVSEDTAAEKEEMGMAM
jgi:hypothetical protein